MFFLVTIHHHQNTFKWWQSLHKLFLLWTVQRFQFLLHQPVIKTSLALIGIVISRENSMSNVMKMLFNQIPHYVWSMVVRAWWFIVITELDCILMKITISCRITMTIFYNASIIGCARWLFWITIDFITIPINQKLWFSRMGSDERKFCWRRRRLPKHKIINTQVLISLDLLLREAWASVKDKGHPGCL